MNFKFKVECEEHPEVHPFHRTVYFNEMPMYVERTDMADVLVFANGVKVELPPQTLHEEVFEGSEQVGKASDRNYRLRMSAVAKLQLREKLDESRKVVGVQKPPIILPGGPQ